jgi:hypothetical protein
MMNTSLQYASQVNNLTSQGSSHQSVKKNMVKEKSGTLFNLKVRDKQTNICWKKQKFELLTTSNAKYCHVNTWLNTIIQKKKGNFVIVSGNFFEFWWKPGIRLPLITGFTGQIFLILCICTWNLLFNNFTHFPTH